MVSPVLMFLAAEVGKPVATAVLKRLSETRGAEKKLHRALETVQQGVPIVAALKGEFGESFSKAITDAIGRSGAPDWSYEAGREDYIKVDSKSVGADKLVMLRDELNINLDRLAILGKQTEGDLRNYFRGVFSVWKFRYSRTIGLDERTSELFMTIDQLLDVGDHTFKDVLELLAKTSLGGVGALMIISGVLLATSTGVGLATAISIWLLGIPWLSVAILVIPGAILLGLARYPFGKKHAMSMCVSIAYKILDQGEPVVRPSNSSLTAPKPVKKKRRTTSVSKVS